MYNLTRTTLLPRTVCCPSRSAFLRAQCAHNTNITSVMPPWGGWTVFNEKGYNGQCALPFLSVPWRFETSQEREDVELNGVLTLFSRTATSPPSCKKLDTRRTTRASS